MRGQVVFKNVNFHYPTRPEIFALHNASFTAAPGEVTAIVGPSGAGKTTIFQVLQRFHDAQSGAITIDGIAIAKLSLDDLRSAIAIVSQDPVIFSGSVSDNIRFGSPNATQEQVVEAAKAARVDDFAMELPNGYDSLLGERGVMLSGGQRQRISIARAILRNAPILLLDEATSALDSESESLIQKALAKLTKGRTTLVIAHRLATVRNADRILVMDRGKILTQGTHSQLVKTNALYARLAKLQFNARSI